MKFTKLLSIKTRTTNWIYKLNYQLASLVRGHGLRPKLQDAMALGRKYGKPTFFCTMTFNPDWPEIRECLLPGQSASDIPTIVARVFKSRLEKVLQVLHTSFGTKKYMIKVIEFQKRGFPHAHIIIKVSLTSLYPTSLKN